MADTDDYEPNDDRGVARVLRAAGTRASPSEEMQQAVRAAVRDEWRAAVAERARRRRMRWVAVAAGVAVAGLGLWASRLLLQGPGPVVASVSRTIGAVTARDAVWSPWHATRIQQQLRAGDDLKTGADGRAALALPGGVSLRLDHDTRIALVGVRRINVSSGAIYVDTGRRPGAADALQVETPIGVVRHLGTQFEVKVAEHGVRIRVREGRIELNTLRGVAREARTGDELLVSAGGGISSGRIAPSSSEWKWVVSSAPPFAIEGRPVGEFLAWVGRELGREIVFATPESAAEASRAVLSGSVAGLAADEALAAVLPTTRLHSLERGEQIVITLDSAP